MVDGNAKTAAAASVGRGGSGSIDIREFGVFEFVVRGADGEIRQVEQATNALTTEGASRILDSWRSTSDGDALATLYVGLIEDTFGAAQQAASDTLTSNNYTEADWDADADYARKTWNPGAASAGSLSAASATWDLAGVDVNQVLTGAFLTNSSASGTDSSKKLIATSGFTAGSTITLGSNDTLTITFTITLS